MADDEMSSLVTSPRSAIQSQKSKSDFFVMFEGFWLILRSSYLIYISLFLWLSAVVSSVFYFQVWLFCICVLPFIIELIFISYYMPSYKWVIFYSQLPFLHDFQKVTIVATTISSPTTRRRTFALINSFIAVFILAGQLTLTVFCTYWLFSVHSIPVVRINHDTSVKCETDEVYSLCRHFFI